MVREVTDGQAYVVSQPVMRAREPAAAHHLTRLASPHAAHQVVVGSSPVIALQRASSVLPRVLAKSSLLAAISKRETNYISSRITRASKLRCGRLAWLRG
ncbi:hypothetical protein E2C01_049385 [Portunus trituberculatus]|uniref:Uncharacterized protein n=1 Tax=Portunus trituberculatus TaxID=210409 RepID=A0A5B7G5E8_PORTR|nr:hypothetical protein [Portunus trituberculatus]